MAEPAEEPPRDLSWLPEGKTALADGDYDAIILGTGLTECILSGLLSTKGMRVLHIDRNDYYGSDTASLSLTSLYQKFRGGPPPSNLGQNRDWNVDLIPKFIMVRGNLAKILLKTQVTRYLEFKSISGSFVYRDAKLHKVPATTDEALKSALMGLFEKRRFRNLLMFVSEFNFEASDELKRITSRDLFARYDLDDLTQNFIGHAMALQTSDSYLAQPAHETAKALRLYCQSLDAYGNSPYLYPLYGLGGLPEGFSRLSAIHSGTYMLHTQVGRILSTTNGEGGQERAYGVETADGLQQARARVIIGEASYFDRSKVRVTGQVVRSIFILNQPIGGIGGVDSAQIIIPASTIGRMYDVYLCSVSFAHAVAAQGFTVAIAATTVEGQSDPIRQLDPAVRLLTSGSIVDRFDSISPLHEPVGDGSQDGCFISKSYDATSHFESLCDDVLNLYTRVTGQVLDLTVLPDDIAYGNE